MNKFTTALGAASVALALAVAPASAAENSAPQALSSSSSAAPHKDVTVNRDNDDAIPTGFTLPRQRPLGSAYTGSAPLSIGLGLIALAALGRHLADSPHVKESLLALRPVW